MLTLIRKIQIVALLTVSLLGAAVALAEAPEPPPAPEAVEAEFALPDLADPACPQQGNDLGEATLLPPVAEPQPAANCCVDLCLAACGSEPCLCSRRLCQVLACGV